MSEKKRKGFAAMKPEVRREIAKMGGAAVPHDKRSFAKDPELAREAGRKGGLAARAARIKPEQF